MVEADCGRSHELHAASSEQTLVATGARAHYQGVGPAHVFRADVNAFPVNHLVRQPFQRLADVRDFVVNYYFHYALAV